MLNSFLQKGRRLIVLSLFDLLPDKGIWERVKLIQWGHLINLFPWFHTSFTPNFACSKSRNVQSTNRTVQLRWQVLVENSSTRGAAMSYLSPEHAYELQRKVN